jgi:hypothetical protein
MKVGKLDNENRVSDVCNAYSPCPRLISSRTRFTFALLRLASIKSIKRVENYTMPFRRDQGVLLDSSRQEEHLT